MPSATPAEGTVSREGLIEDIRSYLLANCPSRPIAIGSIGHQLRRKMKSVSDLDSLSLEEARTVSRLVRKWYPDRRAAASDKILKKYAS